MSALASELREQSRYTTGENGALEMKTSSNSVLDSFVNILKDTEACTVRKAVQQMIHDISYLSSDEERAQTIHDIFILAFHKRATSKVINKEQISDGEGLKNVYYEYILELYNFYPKTIISLVNRRDMFMYGYWKDIYLIWEKINKLDISFEEKYAKYNPLILAFRHTIIQQRGEDLDLVYNIFGRDTIKDMNESQFTCLLNSKSNVDFKISYVGKYCVRENSSFDKRCYWFIRERGHYIKINLVDFMIRYTLRSYKMGSIKDYPAIKNIPFGAKKSWRRDNVKLNVILNVPENKFCSNKWSEINFKNIPSICFKQKTKALLNEKREVLNDSEYDYEYTGNRFPENIDRVACRHNLIEYITESKNINCSQLYPHQIIGDPTKNTTSYEKTINRKMWDSLIEYTKDRVYKYIEENTLQCNRSITIGNILCCADVSGSMTAFNKIPNRPIDIAVALTAFISEIASENYKDIAMSFTDVPTIFEFRNNGKKMDMYDRVSTIMSRVGYSTNYIGIHTCLIELCKKKNIREEEIPTLIIFSDGHFDNQIITHQSSSTMTTHEFVVKMWIDAGYAGPPHIVYWNLAANKNSVQVSREYPNVQLLSGAGVSNIKYVLYGEKAEETTEEIVIDRKIKTIVSKNITPEQTMRKALDESYFDNIRDVLNKSNEGYLKLFN
jgi:hypothetical protein